MNDNKMILFVVDTQKGCFDESLYVFETVRDNINYKMVCRWK